MYDRSYILPSSYILIFVPSIHHLLSLFFVLISSKDTNNTQSNKITIVTSQISIPLYLSIYLSIHLSIYLIWKFISQIQQYTLRFLSFLFPISLCSHRGRCLRQSSHRIGQVVLSPLFWLMVELIHRFVAIQKEEGIEYSVFQSQSNRSQSSASGEIDRGDSIIFHIHLNLIHRENNNKSNKLYQRIIYLARRSNWRSCPPSIVCTPIVVARGVNVEVVINVPLSFLIPFNSSTSAIIMMIIIIIIIID